MSNKIVFPIDDAGYFRKARLLLKEEKNKEALDLIVKAYEISKDIQVNIFYAFLLSQFERYEEALEIMNQEKATYMNNENHAKFYTEVLIKTQKFIEAEYIIQKYKHGPTRIDEYVWGNLEQSLLEERKTKKLEINLRRETIKRSLRELEQHSHMVQMNKIREAEILDLSELQEIAPIILINTDISGTVQRYFIELLGNKGDQNVYSFQWFNQIKKICPVELPRFADVELVHEISNVIEEKLVKYPDLEVRVKIEMMYDLLLLYPYIDETIKDVEFWVNAYISELDFFNYVKIKPIGDTEEHQDMMRWINYLNTVAQRHQMFV